MELEVVHKTKYKYQNPCSLCYNNARLVPLSAGRQTCTHYEIDIEPKPSNYTEFIDFFGNRVSNFSIEKQHATLVVVVKSRISLENQPDFVLEHDMPWESVSNHIKSNQPIYGDLIQFTLESPMVLVVPEVLDYALKSYKTGVGFYEGTLDLMHRIYRDFKFNPGFTTINTPVAEVMKHRKGVCQDFAHLAIACIRSLGLPARYVSGYIETFPAPGKKKLVGSDASHAWFSIYLPERGWLDFDPTNNKIPQYQHITTAYGRDYADVAPLKGVIYSNGKHELKVEVDVRSLR